MKKFLSIFYFVSLLFLASCGGGGGGEEIQNGNSNINSQTAETDNTNTNTSEEERQKKLEEYATLLTEAKTESEEAMGMDVINNKAEMESKLTSVKSKLDKIAQIEGVEVDGLEVGLIKENIKKVESKLNSIKEINEPSIYVDLATKYKDVIIKGLIFRDKDLFAYTDTSLIGPIKDGNINDSVEYKIKEGTISSLTFDAKNKNLVLFILPGRIAQFKSDNTFQAVESPSLAGAKEIIDYSKNIYFLDANNSKIWKSEESNGKYEGLKETLQGNNLEKSGVVSFAIDGNIYLLLNEGKVLKFNQGKKIEMTLDFSIGMVNNLSKISSNMNQSNIYILNNKDSRIIVARKSFSNLNLLRLFTLTGKDIRGMEIDGNEKILYVSDKDKIYKIEM